MSRGAGSAADPTLCRLTENCLRLFSQCLRVPGLAPETIGWLENNQVRLRWWSFSLNAHHTKRSSLDHKVTHHARLQSAISDLLLTLADSLVECLDALQNRQHEPPETQDDPLSDATSSIPSDTESSSSLSSTSGSSNGLSLLPFPEQAVFVEQCLRQLARLSVLIRRSGDRQRHRRADEGLARLERSASGTYQDLKNSLRTIVLLGVYEHSLLTQLERAADVGEVPRSVVVVFRHWAVNPSRLGRVQERLIQANIVRHHRIVYSRQRSHPSNTPAALEQPPVQRQLANIRATATQPPTVNRLGVGQGTTMIASSDMPIRPTAPPTAVASTTIGSDLDRVLIVKTTKASSMISKLTRIGQKQDYPKCTILDKSLICPYCCTKLEEDHGKSDKKWS
jgi:hypothetical protein